MSYVAQFLLGGTIMVCAALLSKSKYLFLSGVITLLPIMTLANIYLQMHHMSVNDFRLTQKNAMFGAFGVVIFIALIFTLTQWVKPLHAVFGAFTVYVLYMIGCKLWFAA